MIVPELKSLISIDLPDGKMPADTEDCAIFCEAEIGIKGEEGAEIFSFTVVTPKFLAHQTGYRWGRGYLLVNFFSWEVVKEALNKLITRCNQESDWPEVAHELNKELIWEFEYYRDNQFNEPIA